MSIHSWKKPLHIYDKRLVTEWAFITTKKAARFNDKKLVTEWVFIDEKK